MKRTLLTLCALIPVIAYGAAGQTPDISFMFRDNPGTYKIRIQTVKDVKKSGADYTSTPLTFFVDNKLYTSFEKVYVQSATDKYGQANYFSEIFSLPKEATAVRISIRKLENGETVTGGFEFVAADKLRKLDAELGDPRGGLSSSRKSYRAGIAIQNQFKNFGSGKGDFTVGHRSIYLP